MTNNKWRDKSIAIITNFIMSMFDHPGLRDEIKKTDHYGFFVIIKSGKHMRCASNLGKKETIELLEEAILNLKKNIEAAKHIEVKSGGTVH